MSLNYGTRKLQKVRYSYLTPLPVHWVKSMKLFKGDSLRIKMLDDYFRNISGSHRVLAGLLTRRPKTNLITRRGIGMKNITSQNISFSAWAKEKCALYPEIVKHMRNSTDPLERAIAIRIMKNAEVDQL